MFTDNVSGAVQASPLWVALNQKAKEMYEQTNRIPCEEEYTALRTMLICKVMLEDPSVQEVACQSMYAEFNA